MDENKNENKNNNNNNLKKVINDSEMNETEAIMNQLELLSFTEDKSFDDPTLLQKSKSNIRNGNKELINNFYSNIQNIKENETKDFINMQSMEYNSGNDNNKKDILKLKIDNI
jgi:hypothetical protein